MATKTIEEINAILKELKITKINLEQTILSEKHGKYITATMHGLK
jgi:hypothetical protein